MRLQSYQQEVPKKTKIYLLYGTDLTLLFCCEIQYTVS